MYHFVSSIFPLIYLILEEMLYIYYFTLFKIRIVKHKCTCCFLLIKEELVIKGFSVFCLSTPTRPTGDQEVAGSTPAEVGNILSWRLIMKYFLRSFSPFRWFKKGSCQFLAKECAQYWLTALRTKPANVWLGKLTALDMTPLGWLGRKTSTQTNTYLNSLIHIC